MRNSIGLCQHRLGGLDQDIVLGVGHHFLGNVGVTDGGLSVLDVLGHDAQVVSGMVETVLDSTQSAAGGGHAVDGVHNGLDSVSGALGGADIQVGDAQGLSVHVVDRNLHLVVAVGGIADLELEGLAHGSGIDLAGLNEASPISTSGIFGSCFALSASSVSTSQIILGVINCTFFFSYSNNTGRKCRANLKALIIRRSYRKTLCGRFNQVGCTYLLVCKVYYVSYTLKLAIRANSEHICLIADGNS